MTIWHLRDIVAGKRTMIKSTDVKVIQIPFFEGLKVEKLLEYAEE